MQTHPSNGRVEVGTRGDRVLFRVSGRATHRVSQPVRDFARRVVQVGCRRFEIDLAPCIHIDSTFAGVLALVSLKLKQEGGSLTLRTIPASALDLLSSLGIERAFELAHDLSDHGPVEPPELSAPKGWAQ